MTGKSTKTGWFSDSSKSGTPTVSGGVKSNGSGGFATGANAPLPRGPAAPPTKEKDG